MDLIRENPSIISENTVSLITLQNNSQLVSVPLLECTEISIFIF